nr:Sir2 family NAD-dependent protein deacetylase [Dolosigranulum pigrum]
MLAKWERTGKTVDIITQNVDSLHQAGSTSVIELHGDNHMDYIMKSESAKDFLIFRRSPAVC